MDVEELLRRLGVALAIGLLVGVERHWRDRDEQAGRRTAGVRTFGIIGLFGGVVAALPASAEARLLLLGLALLALTVALVVFRLREAEAEGNFSVTAVVAGQATFALGALAVLGAPAVAGAAAVALTALLASREILHGFVANLRWPELRSAILLLSMTLVALPLVPKGPIAALGGLDLAQVWLLAVVLAAVSFAGHVAVRLLGAARGRLVAGAAAGLVSSTAVTVTNARLASRGEPAPALIAGALAAGAVSYARTGALAWFVSPAMAAPLLPSLAAGAAMQAVGALLLARNGGGEAAEPGGNPFEFGAVLRMALLLGAIALAGEWAAGRFGAAGAAAVAAISGLADVDAVTLSMGALVPDALGAAAAALAVAVAVASNTMAKAVYALALGGRRFGLGFGLGTLAALAGGALALGLGGGLAW